MSAAKNNARLGVENLEGREMMSWGATVPAVMPSGGDRFTFSSGSANGRYSNTTDINRGENDHYSFTAARTGKYTFDAKRAAGSNIDTVIALYDSNNRLMKSNDDISPGYNTDSRMEANLTAGRRYTVVVSKFSGTSNGRYTLTFSEPVLTASTYLAGLLFTSGDATLAGKTLTLNLYGQTKTSFDITDHYIRVRFLDANGNAVHNGYWERGFRTAGRLIPGTPSERNQTWTIDVSGINLSRVTRLELTVGYY